MAPLGGTVIFVDPESFEEGEVADLQNELICNSAMVAAALDLQRCTHVLCEFLFVPVCLTARNCTCRHVFREVLFNS